MYCQLIISCLSKIKIMNKFQIRIKELRIEHKLTQKQLAKLVGKSETGLESWDNDLKISIFGIITH